MTRHGDASKGTARPTAPVTLIRMQISKGRGLGWRQDRPCYTFTVLSTGPNHVRLATDWELRRNSLEEHLWTNWRVLKTVLWKQCRLKTGHIVHLTVFAPFNCFLCKSCMLDTYWIKKAACITKGLWEDLASTCLLRTLFRRHSTPTLPDTIMCQAWIRTHSLRGAGDLHTEPQGRTGVHIVWGHQTQFLHPWITRLPDRFLTARLSTVTCILRVLRCYSRHRRTFPLHNFLQIERDAIHTSGWVKPRRLHLQVSSPS